MNTDNRRDIYWIGKIYIGVEQGMSRYDYPSHELIGTHSFSEGQQVVLGKDYELRSIDKQIQYTNGEWAREYETRTIAIPKEKVAVPCTVELDNNKNKFMNTIPTQLENPTGFYAHYYIQKVKVNPRRGQSLGFRNGIESFEPDFTYGSVDKDAEYFVMRLDAGGSDLKHIAACRIGIHAYADAIYPHLPELAIDLKTRYPLL